MSKLSRIRFKISKQGARRVNNCHLVSESESSHSHATQNRPYRVCIIDSKAHGLPGGNQMFQRNTQTSALKNLPAIYQPIKRLLEDLLYNLKNLDDVHGKKSNKRVEEVFRQIGRKSTIQRKPTSNKKYRSQSVSICIKLPGRSPLEDRPDCINLVSPLRGDNRRLGDEPSQQEKRLVCHLQGDNCRGDFLCNTN